MRAATSARSARRIRSVRSAPELPEPRAEDEQQRAGDGARARRSEPDAPTWLSSTTAPAIVSAIARASAASRPGAASRRGRTTIDDAGDEQAGAEHGARPRGRARSRSAIADDRDERAAAPGAAPVGVRPRGRSRGGSRRRPRARAARTTSRTSVASTPSVCGEPATDAGDDAIVVAALERQRRDLGHGARTTSMRPAPTCASIVSSRRVPVVTLAFVPSSCLAEHVDLAGLGVRVDGDRRVVRDDHAAARRSRRVALTWVGVETADVREVDAEAADADLVRRLDRGGRRRRVDAVADAVATG